MSAATFTNRRTELVTVKSLETGIDFGGHGFGGTPEQKAMLAVGQDYVLETRGLSQITGMATADRSGGGYERLTWLWRYSDQDLERQHQEMVARFAQEREDQWQQNRDDWARREAVLPPALRRRLERFRANGGHDFEVGGWGYELVASELAVLYAASGGEDDEAVEAFASEQGTSGNQHNFAKSLARFLTDDPADQDVIANAISALSPLTGDADYSGANS